MTTTHPIRRRVLQAAGVTSGLSIAFVAIVGFAHTEAGRPLLRYIPGMSACPLDGPPLTAEDRMRVREQTLGPLAGTTPASTRTVLAFELGTTRRHDVDAWALAHGLACAPGRKLALRCTDVPAAALGGSGDLDEVSFDFAPDDTLVALEGSARLADASSAAAFVARRDASLRTSMGEPTTARGEATAAAVARGPLSQVSREFRRSDVRAQVVATNLGHGRFGVREFHQLLPG